MTHELHPAERPLRSGAANLQRGLETVGGTLHLTDRRLLFRAHALNIQSAPAEVGLRDIAAVTPVWTLFLNRIPLLPNSLEVRTLDGTSFRFVLNGRSGWKAAIDAARSAAHGPAAPGTATAP